MTNSMNEVIEKIRRQFKDASITEIDEREIKIDALQENVLGILSILKNEGFSHLSLLTCVDWIENKEFELVYILFSWKDGGKIIVSTRIDRENPKFVTVKHMWPVARFYEREIHEFFGVEFEGNDDMKPLILELWDDIPPLRKDFDPLEYSRKKFPDREYKKDVLQEARTFRGEMNG